MLENRTEATHQCKNGHDKYNCPCYCSRKMSYWCYYIPFSWTSGARAALLIIMATITGGIIGALITAGYLTQSSFTMSTEKWDEVNSQQTRLETTPHALKQGHPSQNLHSFPYSKESDKAVQFQFQRNRNNFRRSSITLPLPSTNKIESSNLNLERKSKEMPRLISIDSSLLPKPIKPPQIQSPRGFSSKANPNVVIHFDSIARPRINTGLLVLVVTGGDKASVIENRRIISQTWAKQTNVRFVTDALGVPDDVAIRLPEPAEQGGLKHLPRKVLMMWTHIAKEIDTLYKDYNFFMKVDDDTFVNIAKLEKDLSMLEPDVPIFLGKKQYGAIVKQTLGPNALYQVAYLSNLLQLGQLKSSLTMVSIQEMNDTVPILIILRVCMFNSKILFVLLFIIIIF